MQEDVAIENVNPQAAIQQEQIQQWNILNAFEAEQAYRQKLQQWFAAENNVELQHHQAIAAAEQRQQEIELQQQQWAAVQEMAIQERRFQKEQYLLNNLNDLYENYSPQSAEHHQENQEKRNQLQNNNDNEDIPAPAPAPAPPSPPPPPPPSIPSHSPSPILWKFLKTIMTQYMHSYIPLIHKKQPTSIYVTTHQPGPQGLHDIIANYHPYVNIFKQAYQVLREKIKYVHKYIYKGPDHATLQTQGHDEIKAYLDGHYISAIEAAWCFFEFDMHLEWPAVYCLPVHLENQQTISYQAMDNVQEVLEAATNRDTSLLGWFKANSDPVCIEAGPFDCLYQDFPKKFIWGKFKVLG